MVPSFDSPTENGSAGAEVAPARPRVEQCPVDGLVRLASDRGRASDGAVRGDRTQPAEEGPRRRTSSRLTAIPAANIDEATGAGAPCSCPRRSCRCPQFRCSRVAPDVRSGAPACRPRRAPAASRRSREGRVHWLPGPGRGRLQTRLARESGLTPGLSPRAGSVAAQHLSHLSSRHTPPAAIRLTCAFPRTPPDARHLDPARATRDVRPRLCR